jgi:hypothetical protein
MHAFVEKHSVLFASCGNDMKTSLLNPVNPRSNIHSTVTNLVYMCECRNKLERSGDKANAEPFPMI